jgi:hypothetical protein
MDKLRKRILKALSEMQLVENEVVRLDILKRKIEMTDEDKSSLGAIAHLATVVRDWVSGQKP